jgi:branched-subunit amino acid ABC-type transport system permease component
VSLHDAAQLALDGLINGSLYGLLGASLGLILGVTGRFHFAYAFVFTIAAYVPAFISNSFTDTFSLPYPLVMAVGLVAAAIAGVLIEGLVYRPLAQRSGGFALLTVFVASLGISIAGENLIRLVAGSASQPLNGPDITGISVAGFRMTSLDVASVIVFWLLLAGLAAGLRYTRAGRVIRAVRVNPDMALAVGIRPARVYLLVFALGSVLAGVAAIFSAVKYAAVPDMGNRPLVYAFVVAFLAGTRSSPLLVGATGMLLGLVESLSGIWLSAQWSSLVVFAVLFVYLALRPVQVRQLLQQLTRPGIRQAEPQRAI